MPFAFFVVPLCLDHTMACRKWNHGFGRGGLARAFWQWLPFHIGPGQLCRCTIEFAHGLNHHEGHEEWIWMNFPIE